jgi:peptide chain release factor subunit 1
MDARRGGLGSVPLQANEIDSAEIRRLAKLHLPGRSVVSLYLGLDPASAKLPGARRTQLESLLSEIERRHLDDGDGSRDQRAALRASLERIRRFFAAQAFAAKAARGVAVFSAEDAGLFEAYRLPRPVEAQVSVDDRPHVEPLLDLVGGGSWAVLLSSRRAARVLRGSADRLVEVESLRDDVHRWHSKGGWSQARFQRGIEKETLDHVKRSCETLFELYERAPFEHLIVGGSDDVLPVVEDHLHPYLRERLAGRIEADVERASAEEVLDRAGELIAETERRAERQLLDRLAAGLGTGNQAVAGRDQVMVALRERRVAVLLVAEGAAAEEQIELAIAQSAEARVLRHCAAELREQGSVGALLRF